MEDIRRILKGFEKFEENEQIIKVFGTIVYSDAHAHIKKVLKDEDYWKALDKISGNRWAIFAARALQGQREIRGGDPPGSLGMMIQAWVEPEENKKLIEALGLETTEKPVFVVFTRLNNGEILKSVIELYDTSIEKTYQRIKKIVQDITASIEQIEEENISDYESVFNAVDMTVQRIKTVDTLKRIFAVYKWFKRIKP